MSPPTLPSRAQLAEPSTAGQAPMSPPTLPSRAQLAEPSTAGQAPMSPPTLPSRAQLAEPSTAGQAPPQCPRRCCRREHSWLSPRRRGRPQCPRRCCRREHSWLSTPMSPPTLPSRAQLAEPSTAGRTELPSPDVVGVVPAFCASPANFRSFRRDASKRREMSPANVERPAREVNVEKDETGNVAMAKWVRVVSLWRSRLRSRAGPEGEWLRGR